MTLGPSTLAVSSMGSTLPISVRPCRTVTSGAAVKIGDLEFALADRAPHLFILGYQFGSQEWCDAPFEAHRATQPEMVVETAGEPLPLRILLVNADTGIREEWRFCELTADFADAMRASVRAQMASPYEPDTAGALLNHLYQHFPSPKVLLEEFTSVSCRVQ